MSDIVLNVPFIRQAKSMSCWYACASMVAAHFEHGPRLGLPDLWTPNMGLDFDIYPRLATVEGLVSVVPASGNVTTDLIGEILRSYGPIMATGGYSEGMALKKAHVIVLTGLVGKTIYFNDPKGAGPRAAQASTIISHLHNFPFALMTRNPGR